MPIEFQCQSCSKTLRIPDTAVGKRVKCPSCQQVSTVPAESAAPTTPPPAANPPAANPFAADPKKSQAEQGGNPYASPSMAASRGPAGALGSGSGKLEASKAVATAWMLFKENIGLLVGCVVVLMVVAQVISGVQQAVQFAITEGPIQPGRNPNPENVLMLVGATLVFTVLSQAVQGFLWIGLIRIQLCIARGQETSFGMLFSGGRWFLKVFFANLLFGLIVGLGFVALIVPGIYLMLRYWSYSHFIVDKDCGIMESFNLAGEASKGNLGETFVLGLIGFGLMILGVVMLCIGILFTAPIVYLSTTVAYLMMSAQRFRQAT